jgi:hypothetical protein
MGRICSMHWREVDAKFWYENLKKIDHLEDTDLNVKKIFKK